MVRGPNICFWVPGKQKTSVRFDHFGGKFHILTPIKGLLTQLNRLTVYSHWMNLLNYITNKSVTMIKPGCFLLLIQADTHVRNANNNEEKHVQSTVNN